MQIVYQISQRPAASTTVPLSVCIYRVFKPRPSAARPRSEAILIRRRVKSATAHRPGHTGPLSVPGRACQGPGDAL